MKKITRSNGSRKGRIVFLFVLVFIFFLLIESKKPACQTYGRRKIKEQPIDFTSLSLEELKQVMIISILKKPQELSEATSAISVITEDNIRRSSASNIPELLRLVPGFQVAQISTNTWAVSARGFNNRYANKLLVLMDGRSLYTPFFSGVYWGVLDTILEDIERIEVIRGPGATLWGANAVNGVINIITKEVKDTQGALVTSGWGSEPKGLSAFRYGFNLKDDAYARLYVKYLKRDCFLNKSGDRFHYSWDSLRGGARIDWHSSSRSSFTIQGDVYEGDDMEKGKKTLAISPYYVFDLVDNNTIFSGGNILFRWTRTFFDISNITLQVYYDKTKKDFNNNFLKQYRENFDIFDLDFQHSFSLNQRQEIVWGFGYRSIKDNIEDLSIQPILLIDPFRRDTRIVSAFVQDGINIVRDRLQLTIGSKFENNDYTGSEVQPSVRILWKPTKKQNVWAAVSRALRTPSRLEHDDKIPYFINLIEEKIEAERLIAYELGYRIRPSNNFSLDVALFYNEYNKLILFVKNIAWGETYGIEISVDCDILKWWRLRASYSSLNMDIKVREDIISPLGFLVEFARDFLTKGGSNPHDQFLLVSSIDFFYDMELDLDFRYVDNLQSYIKNYLELDAHLAWKPKENLELSISGKNLLHKSHPEFLSIDSLATLTEDAVELKRSVYGKIICHF